MALSRPSYGVDDAKYQTRHARLDRRRRGRGARGAAMDVRALPRLLTLEQIHELTRRSRSSLYTDIALGRLRVTHLGRSVRVFEQDYLDYVERGRHPMSFLRRS
jgi:predicted DNA-binding transcriptional regulator AlpA